MQRMSTFKLTFLAAALLGCASSSFASNDAEKKAEPVPARTASATNNPPGYDKDEMVCRREKVTGSRFARNLCHTREQWEAMRKAGVEGTGNIQRAPVPLISE
jgi:hypothetical protein